MKIAILDVYPFFNHRLIKDTAGGYGTGNDFGNSFFSKILNFFVDNMIGMPPINIMYIESILNDFETASLILVPFHLRVPAVGGDLRKIRLLFAQIARKKTL